MSDLRIKELELEIEKIKQGTPVEEKVNTFSIWWFIFWLLVCWPIGLLYLIAKKCG